MNVMREAVRFYDQNDPFCLALIVAKSGSAPQTPGAKGLFLRDGRIVGTIGGGCLEMEARRIGLQALAAGEPILREFKLDDDFGWDDGLICGGRVQVLLLPNPKAYVDALRAACEPSAKGVVEFWLTTGRAEFIPFEALDAVQLKALSTRRETLFEERFILPVAPAEKLVVFGAGHIGAQIANMASGLGFSVTIVDDRAEFLAESRLPNVNARVEMKPSQFAASLQTDDDTYLCIVTRGHRNDALVLRELINKPHAYIGMIGSKRKREVVRAQMLRENLCTESQFEKVRSPMGLDIGAETVEEIAVSVLAEIVRVRAEKRGPVAARCGQRPMAVRSTKPAE